MDQGMMTKDTTSGATAVSAKESSSNAVKMSTSQDDEAISSSKADFLRADDEDLSDVSSDTIPEESSNKEVNGEEVEKDSADLSLIVNVGSEIGSQEEQREDSIESGSIIKIASGIIGGDDDNNEDEENEPEIITDSPLPSEGKDGGSNNEAIAGGDEEVILTLDNLGDDSIIIDKPNSTDSVEDKIDESSNQNKTDAGAETRMECDTDVAGTSSGDGLNDVEMGDKPRFKKRVSVVPVTTTNKDGILEIISIPSAHDEDDMDDTDFVIQSVRGGVSMDDESNKKNESDSDDENQGIIRLRDFSTLKEKSDDEDEDDDVILLTPPTAPTTPAQTKKPTPKKPPTVKLSDLTVDDNKEVQLELESGSGSGVTNPEKKKSAEAKKIKVGLLRRQLSYLTQQLATRNGVITLKPTPNGVVQAGNLNTFTRLRAVPVTAVRTYQKQPVLVTISNRPVPGLRPASSFTQVTSGMVIANDRLVRQPVGSPTTFTTIRNDTIVRPGSTPGTLQVISGARTASQLYQQQQRIASAAQAQTTTYRVASGSVSSPSQRITIPRNQLLYNTAGGNFVTPMMPTGRVYSGVIPNTPTGRVYSGVIPNTPTGRVYGGVIHDTPTGRVYGGVIANTPTGRVYGGVIPNTPTGNSQQQQGVRLASLASVTSQIMGSGRVARMQLSNADSPHLTTTVVNGATTMAAPVERGTGVQTFILDSATGSMIPLSSYQDLTRAVVTQRPHSVAPAATILRPRVRQLTPITTTPSLSTSVARYSGQQLLNSSSSPRSSVTSVNKGGRPRSKAPTTPPLIQPAPTVRAPQLIQQATRLPVPQNATNGISSAASSPGSSTNATAGSMQSNNSVLSSSMDSGEQEFGHTKTFPSLVVSVKPCLHDKIPKPSISASRVDLDARVKTFLMYSPSKFTEYLMQNGLIRLQQNCPSHPQGGCKLAMYNDGGKKHPFSGGYVWISECCGDKHVSVFNGSIFEASVYPPGTLMKLIYHWACQTPAISVLQWVKVTSYYLKNFFTLLRSACVAGLHEHAVEMGGKGKYVEIGIITLGTTVNGQSGVSKQVKIEILGVFDPVSKMIRMKVLNPQDEKGGGDRISQILWPLHAWVNKQSFILIDSSLDKTLLEGMGFAHVSQRPSHSNKNSTVPTNVNVMNYLKNVVPKMFQNTLCVLSKSLIQQFLDELSWRELWGTTPSNSFDNLLQHLIEMTRAELGESLISRLNRISLNPFSEWSYTPKSSSNTLETQSFKTTRPTAAAPTTNNTQTQAKVGSSNTKERNSALSALDSLGELAASFMGNARKRKLSAVDEDSSRVNSLLAGKDLHKLAASGAKLYTVQSYYYACIAAGIVTGRPVFPSALKCPMCMRQLTNNIDAMRHLMQHVVYQDRPSWHHMTVCSYCLKEIPSGTSLAQHVEEKHKLADAQYACRICCLKFGRENDLIVHMWTHHVEAETPYHCDLCSYRSSFHFDVVDHFSQTHRDIDCTMCPVCLKTMAVKSMGDLKLIVLHLQNHQTRKSKKCQDCILSFPDPKDLTAHILMDKAHSSQSGHASFKRHKVTGTPIGMAKPPPVNRRDRIPPPPPPKKSKTGGGVKPGVKTLNSAISIPINPNEKFTYDRFTMRFTGCAQQKCYECDADLTPSHFTGRLKCNKCRYVTSCPTAMAEHTKLHPNLSSTSAPVASKSMKLPGSLKKLLKSNGPVSCLSCKTVFELPDLLIQHMTTVCNQRSCKVDCEEIEDIPLIPAEQIAS